MGEAKAFERHCLLRQVSFRLFEAHLGVACICPRTIWKAPLEADQGPLPNRAFSEAQTHETPTT
jgi:hypothetical protein